MHPFMNCCLLKLNNQFYFLQFRKRIFWLPHNIDFRGRVYPIPPYLSHVSCDAARALLLFAKGQKLGPEGLDWLKVCRYYKSSFI